MRRSITRTLLAGTLTAMAAGLLATVGTTPASATPTICDPSSEWVKVSRAAKKYVITHVRGLHLPPGGSAELTKSATYKKELHSSRTRSWGVDASAAIVIFTAEGKYGVDLAKANTTTGTSNESVTFNIGSSSNDRYYAVYAGRKYWTGDWDRYKCNSRGDDYRVIGSGTWRSYQVKLEGAAKCPASRYDSWSLPYKACKLTWG